MESAPSFENARTVTDSHIKPKSWPAKLPVLVAQSSRQLPLVTPIHTTGSWEFMSDSDILLHDLHLGLIKRYERLTFLGTLCLAGFAEKIFSVSKRTFANLGDFTIHLSSSGK